MASITVVGSVNLDMVIKVPRLPRPGETVLGGPFLTAPGGKGANQAVAAARLGAAVHFVARVGQDVFGEQLLQGYLKERIDADLVSRDPEAPTGVCLIMVDAQGQNCLAAAPGANDRLSPADVRQAEGIIASSDILLLQLENPLDAIHTAAEIAHSHRVPIILNPAPARAIPPDLLRLVDVLTPNETEASTLTGLSQSSDQAVQEMARLLLHRGPRVVVITLGARGALVAESERMTFLPAYRVQAVDATAAGDAFNGALAVALASQQPLLEAVRYASAVAALSVTRLGAQPSLPHAEEVERFLTTAVTV